MLYKNRDNTNMESKKMTLQGGLILLEEIFEDLPSAEKRAAQFILKNPYRVILLNITQLARESGSSIAGVVRLCKRLGMQGFKELKLRVTWEISKNPEEKKFLRLEPGLSIENIARSVVHNSEKVLDSVLKMLDVSSLDQAAGAILKAERVDIYGVGASGIVAADLYQKLLRIGMKCSYNSDNHLQLTSACSLDRKDCAIAISYSGETQAVIKTIQEARKSRAHTISITRFGKNSVASFCDIKLFVPSTEPLIREGAMTSRISQLVLVDILFSVIASRDSRFLKYLSRTMEALKMSKM